MSVKLSKVKRESTGIVGIDKMIQGGLPKGGVFGISGPPGAGKSIFSLQFVLEGARAGDKSVYINLEEPRSNVDNMLAEFEFGKEFLELEKKGLIVVKCFDYEKYSKVSEDLFRQVGEDKKIGRLVIDSFNCFFASGYELEGKTEFGVRKMITEVFRNFRGKSFTTLLTLEREEKGFGEANYNIHYLVDGLLNLDYLDMGVVERRVFVPKMRWTAQSKEGVSYEIGADGILIGEGWGE